MLGLTILDFIFTIRQYDMTSLVGVHESHVNRAPIVKT